MFIFILLFCIFCVACIFLIIGIGYFIQLLNKKYWSKKIANYFILGYSVLVLYLAVQLIFEDQLFSKNDTKVLIEEQDITLTDDFILLNNKTESAIGDYYHTFELEISENDKNKAIEAIRKSENFKPNDKKIVSFLNSPDIDRYNGKKQIQNYETQNAFIREYFEPNGEGFAPTFRRILILKNTNKLIFEDIDE